MGWLSDWAHRIDLTGDSVKIDETLEHPPLTIFLGGSVGQDGDDTTCVFDRLGSDANRKKIALTKANGTSQIYVEIEYWDTSSEFAILHASHPDLELLSTEDPVVRLYYDPSKADNTTYVGDTEDTAAQNVWNSGYDAVLNFGAARENAKIGELVAEYEYHLGGDEDGDAGFSTDGSPTDNDTYYTFDGIDDGLHMGSDWGDESDSDILIHAKVRIHDKSAGTQAIWKSGGYVNGIAVGLDASGNLGIFGNDGGSITSITIPAANVPENTWIEIEATPTSVTVTNASTGSEIDSDTGTATAGNGSANESIGFSHDQSPITGTNSTGDYFKGDIDFVKIYTNAGEGEIAPDSTSNKNHATFFGGLSSTDLDTTEMLIGIDLDGSDDYLEFLHSFTLNDPCSVEAVHAEDTQSNARATVFEQRNSGTNGGRFATLRYDNWGWWDSTGVAYDTGGDLSHVAGTKDGADGECFLDGVSQGTTSQLDTATPDYPATIGARRGGDGSINSDSNFDGPVRAIRISSVERSAAWFKATRAMLLDDFWRFGEEKAYADYGGKSGVQVVSLSVADVTGAVSLRSALGTCGILGLLNSLPMYGEQILRLKMSDDLLQVLRLCASGDQGVQNLLAGMGISRAQSLCFQLGTFAAGAQVLRSQISGDPAQAVQVLRNVIDENNRVVGVQSLLLALKDAEALYPDIPCSISIDGKPVRYRIISASVDYSQDGVHNAITIVSSDFDLYSLADPDILPGEQRIELQVGTRVLYFMIEERSGDDRQWSIWGRSLSAREDVPHAKEIAYTQDEPESASSVAESLCATCVVDWEAPDWVLPEDFEFFGSPLEGVKQIASAIEAVVRSQDDGSITARRRYPTRPVDLATASPDVTYSVETEVIEVGYRRITGDRYNAVTVNGYSPEVFLPDLEAEETNPIQGTDVHVRAYWAGQIPTAPPTVYVTAGSVIKLADGIDTQSERVVFSGGVGELSYPPEEISTVSWIGAQGGGVSWEKHVKTLGISTTEPRLASVTYTTQYARYRLYGHDVPELVFTMVVSAGNDASVRVKMGVGDREALSINEPLLTSAGICVERGRAFLDENGYVADEIDIKAPYQDAAVDGAVVCLEQDGLHISGNALILAAGIEIAGPRVTNQLRVRKWRVS